MEKIVFTFIGIITFLVTSTNLSAQYPSRNPDSKNKSEDLRQLLAPAKDARASSHQAEFYYQRYYNEAVKNGYYYEGFETWIKSQPWKLPQGWNRYRTTSLTGNPFSNDITNLAPGTGNLNWYMNNPDLYPYNDGDPSEYVKAGSGSIGCFWDAKDFTWAVSPTIALPTSGNNLVVNFWVWVANNFTDGWYSRFHVRVYADGQWTTLYSYNPQTEGSNLFDAPTSLSLNDYKGKNVRIAFVHQWNKGIQIAIDEIYAGPELKNDFGLSFLEIAPSFGLLPGDQAYVWVHAEAFGTNGGPVTVTLKINGQVRDTFTTGTLARGGNPELVTFIWTPRRHGEHRVEVTIPDDDFNQNNVLSQTVYINHYYNLAQDFENFGRDEQGNRIVVSPQMTGQPTTSTGFSKLPSGRYLKG